MMMIVMVMLMVVALFLYLTTYFCLLFRRLSVEHSSLHIYILVIDCPEAYRLFRRAKSFREAGSAPVISWQSSKEHYNHGHNKENLGP